jgi:GTPase Era involved in 16S rRNA processing
VIERLSDDSFKVAVIGEFSSGKSTFLNALIGRDLLLHGRQETTATVTRIVNTSPNDPSYNTCLVTFENGEIMNFANLDSLKWYTTTQSELNVAKSIKHVDIFTHVLEANCPVVFIDTPGLNGTAEDHRERTVELIKSAHACIYVLQARGLSETDFISLRLFTRYQEDFIFVQNHIDTYNAMEGESLEAQLRKQHDLLQQKVFLEKETCYKLCGISALKALAAKDKSIKFLYDTDKTPINEEQRAIFYAESNIDTALLSLKELMFDNQLKSKQVISAVNSAVKLIEYEISLLTSDFNIQETIWANSKDAKFTNHILNILENWEKRKETNCDILRNLIISRILEEKSIIKSETEKLFEKFRDDALRSINSIQTLDDLEKYMQEDSLAKQINNSLKICLINDVKELIDRSKACVVDTAIAKLKKLADLTDLFPDIQSFNFKYDIELDSFASQESMLTTLEKSVLDTEKKLSEAKLLKAAKQSEMKGEESNYEKLQNYYCEIKDQYKDKFYKLGNKPPPEKKYRPETVFCERGWGPVGWLIDTVFGQKTKTIEVPYDDFSKQEKWKNKKCQIENDYRRKINKIENQQNFIFNKIHEINNDIIMANDEIKKNVRSLKLRKDAYESKKLTLEETKRVAVAEYIKISKDSFNNQLETYMEEIMKPLLLDYIDTEMERVKDPIINEIIIQYKDSAQKQFEKIQTQLQSHTLSKPSEELKQNIEIMEKIKGDLISLFQE